jgi:hypothetical protein
MFPVELTEEEEKPECYENHSCKAVEPHPDSRMPLDVFANRAGAGADATENNEREKGKEKSQEQEL